MAITDLPLFSMLRTRMQWHQERQRLLAENVANADTPNYRPRDLAPLQFDRPAPASRRSGSSAPRASHIGRVGRRRRAGSRPRGSAATRCARPATPSTSKTR